MLTLVKFSNQHHVVTSHTSIHVCYRSFHATLTLDNDATKIRPKFGTKVTSGTLNRH